MQQQKPTLVNVISKEEFFWGEYWITQRSMMCKLVLHGLLQWNKPQHLVG